MQYKVGHGWQGAGRGRDGAEQRWRASSSRAGARLTRGEERTREKGAAARWARVASDAKEEES